MPDQLPPIGSLWQHRVSGERRFVLYTGEMTIAYFAVNKDGADLCERQIGITDWLVWQAEADRIDREEP